MRKALLFYGTDAVNDLVLCYVSLKLEMVSDTAIAAAQVRQNAKRRGLKTNGKVELSAVTPLSMSLWDYSNLPMQDASA